MPRDPGSAGKSVEPKVSICLTTYNRAATLPKTVDSLLTQTFTDFELIISDDCSTDGTQAICHEYEKADGRVRYCRNQTNLKMPGNLNAAIGRARAEYIANVHDGDLYRPDLIEEWKRALDRVPTASFVFNAYHLIGRRGERTLHRQPFELRVEGKQIALHHFRTFTSCVWGTVMARRSAYERAGPFNARYGFISDVDMWLRLARDSDVAYVSEPLIVLTPREPTHPYSFVHWRLTFWELAIYVAHLELYKDAMPVEVAEFRGAYPSRRRFLLLKDMAICIRHKRWDRAAEGLAIWRDSDDKLLAGVGRALGNPANLPDWYSAGYWDGTRPLERP